MSKDKLPEGHGRIARTQSMLGACLTVLGRYAEAESLLHQGYAGLLEKRGADPPITKNAASHFIALYNAWGKPEMAARYRAL